MDDVAIVGGGIGGLAAAVALERRGFETAVYEAAEEPRAVGAGTWVSPNGVAALDRLGVAESVREAGIALDRAAIRTADGGTLVEADLSAARGARPMVSIHGAALHDALADGVPEGTLRSGSECVSVVRDSDRATATFADGSTAESRVLVGADGIDSAVRSSLFPDVSPGYRGYVSFRGLANRRLPDEHHRVGHVIWGVDGRVGHSGVDDRRSYWRADLPVPAGECDWDGVTAKLALRDRFLSFPGPIPELIASTSPSDVVRTEVRDLPRLESWSDGRIGLLGDAAHAMAPTLAQGSAQALEDAVALAAALDEHGLGEQGLAAYERRRKRRVDRIARRSRLLNRVSGIEHPVLRWLRDRTVGLTPGFVTRRAAATLFDPGF